MLPDEISDALDRSTEELSQMEIDDLKLLHDATSNLAFDISRVLRRRGE